MIDTKQQLTWEKCFCSYGPVRWQSQIFILKFFPLVSAKLVINVKVRFVFLLFFGKTVVLKSRGITSVSLNTSGACQWLRLRTMVINAVE